MAQTLWYRLEPSPGISKASNAVTPPAQIRDPLWMLMRQWQLGEFLGADAGSPAWVEFGTSVEPLAEWSASGSASTPISSDRPLDEVALREPFSPDFSVRLELGQLFEEQLTAAGAADLIPAFRDTYLLAEMKPDSPNASRLVALATGRSIDGVSLLDATPQGASLPPLPAVPADKSAAVQQAIKQVRDWAAKVYGSFGDRDPVSWDSTRLAYSLAVDAKDGNGGVQLAAQPSRTADLEWFAFDVVKRQGPPPAPGPLRKLLPAHVRFPGMSPLGYWEFERTAEDLASLEANLGDVGRLAFLDFLLLYSMGWYLLPVDVPAGSLSRVASLEVVDVFGTRTRIEPADHDPRAPCRLFVNSVRGDDKTDGGFLLVSPTPGSARITGTPLEDVRIVRDDLAGLGWGIEDQTQDDCGEPWPGNERAAALRAARPQTEAQATLAAARAEQRSLVMPTRLPPRKPGAVRYRVMTDPPLHWYPLLPVRSNGETDLELAALLDGPADALTKIEPAGRLLQPGLQFPSEHLAREGVRLRRVPTLARWTDGSRHLWIARQRTLGGGVVSSGLKFDTVEPAPDIVVLED
jgi:hypothetical protein